MHQAKVIGIIGKGNLAPQTIKYKKNDGSEGELHKFGLWVEDTRKTDENGSHPRHVVRVLAPPGDRGKNLLKTLQPGRRVMVEGEESFETRTVKTNDETKTYLNIDLNMSQLYFMDAPLSVQINRVGKLAVKAGALTEEEAVAMSGKIETMFSTPKDTTTEDPDKPDFVD